MTGLQTEPFTAPLEPFTTPAGVEEGSEDVRYEDVASEPSSATMHLTAFALNLPDKARVDVVGKVDRQLAVLRRLARSVPKHGGG